MAVDVPKQKLHSLLREYYVGYEEAMGLGCARVKHVAHVALDLVSADVVRNAMGIHRGFDCADAVDDDADDFESGSIVNQQWLERFDSKEVRGLIWWSEMFDLDTIKMTLNGSIPVLRVFL